MNAIGKAISCIGIETSIPCLLGLIFLAKRHKGIALFLLFIFLEIVFTRAFMLQNISSRYFTLLIFPAIIISSRFIGCIIKNNKIFKLLLFIILIGIASIQFSSFNNSYIIDLQNDFANISGLNPDSAIIVDHRESERISSGNYQYIFQSDKTYDIQDEKSFNELIHSFDGWNYPSFYFIKATKRFADNHKTDSSLKAIRSYSSDKHNSKRFLVFKRQPQFNDLKNVFHSEILNGDFERQLSKKEIDKKTKIWSKNNKGYDHVLPEHAILAEFRKEFSFPPIVFSDDQNAISGKYSLHVKTIEETTIYFLNTIDPSEGVLSFKIKLLSGSQVMSIRRRYYYDDKSTKLEPRDYYFFAKQNDIADVHITFDQHDATSKEMLFCLKCKDCEFILDDVAFFKKTGQ